MPVHSHSSHEGNGPRKLLHSHRNVSMAPAPGSWPVLADLCEQKSTFLHRTKTLTIFSYYFVDQTSSAIICTITTIKSIYSPTITTIHFAGTAGTNRDNV